MICNVDCPDDVERGAFESVINVIAETLDLFPYFRLTDYGGMIER